MTRTQLRKHREMLGLSQEELALQVGYKYKQQVNAWEKGERSIPESVPELVERLVALHIKKMQSSLK